VVGGKSALEHQGADLMRHRSGTARPNKPMVLAMRSARQHIGQSLDRSRKERPGHPPSLGVPCGRFVRGGSRTMIRPVRDLLDTRTGWE
jgi:hypothetical protein